MTSVRASSMLSLRDGGDSSGTNVELSDVVGELARLLPSMPLSRLTVPESNDNVGLDEGRNLGGWLSVCTSGVLGMLSSQIALSGPILLASVLLLQQSMTESVPLTTESAQLTMESEQFTTDTVHAADKSVHKSDVLQHIPTLSEHISLES